MCSLYLICSTEEEPDDGGRDPSRVRRPKRPPKVPQPGQGLDVPTLKHAHCRSVCHRSPLFGVSVGRLVPHRRSYTRPVMPGRPRLVEKARPTYGDAVLRNREAIMSEGVASSYTGNLAE